MHQLTKPFPAPKGSDRLKLGVSLLRCSYLKFAEKGKFRGFSKCDFLKEGAQSMKTAPGELLRGLGRGAKIKDSVVYV